MIAVTETHVTLNTVDFAIPTLSVGDDSKAALDKHNSASQKHVDCGAKYCELCDSPMDGTACSLGDVKARTDQRNKEFLAIRQNEVSLLERRLELLELALPELNKAQAESNKERDVAIKKVRQQFERAGLTVEQMDAWPSNPKSAELQLTHILKKSATVQEAEAKYTNLAAQPTLCKRLVNETKSAVDLAKRRRADFVYQIS